MHNSFIHSFIHSFNVINKFISNIELVKKKIYIFFYNWVTYYQIEDVNLMGYPQLPKVSLWGHFINYTPDNTVISNIPRCTNSMMGRIMEAMMMIRRRVSTVDVLILENNNIPHLPSRAFGSIRVNRLFIENNRMVTIDRNAFAGIEEHLVRLYLWLQNIHI